MTRTARSRMFALASLAGSLAGCGDMALLGVSGGGAQDMGLARALIEEGMVPRADQFTVEGLLSEHDLPLADQGCEDLLCPATAAAWVVPVDGSAPGLLVQLGFQTGVDLDSFERPPLNLAVAVDVSGSMAGDKLAAVRDALDAVVERLGGEDRMALVAFDDRSRVIDEGRIMDAAGREAMHRAIARLEDGGSTCIECGLEDAFALADAHAGAPGVEDRVLLFTDAQPNVGDTNTGSFLELTRRYAERGIGLGLYGVGLDLGAELAQEISQVRGGSFTYLADAGAVRETFEEDFDLLVTPVAYDLDVAVAPVKGWGMDEAYGAVPDSGDALEFGAATLFFSHENGGMGALLRADEGEALRVPPALALGGMDMRYEVAYHADPDVGETATAHVGMAFEGGEAWRVEDPGGATAVAADDLGVFKMGVLVDEYRALLAGAMSCTRDLEVADALDRIDRAAARLSAAAGTGAEEQTGDLAAEARLMEQLAENVRRGSCL